MQPTNKIPIVVVVGPTASGKTQAGVAICKEFDGEVVSADSMQIYQQLTIGTAKPTPKEQQGIPHHLLDFLPTSQTFSVASYVKAAHQAIAEIHSRGKLPVVVGGTGLYINALIDNLTFAEEGSDQPFRKKLLEFAQKEGAQALWEQLEAIDPESAATMHPNNCGRVVRAIEIFHTTGRTMTQHQEASRSLPSPYQPRMIGLTCRDRQKLYNRINQRVTEMLEDGLIDEAKWLLENGNPATSLQAIGYKEMLAWLRGEESLECAADNIRLGTRHYAKRQLTWFRRDERITWFYTDDYPTSAELMEAIFHHLGHAG